VLEELLHALEIRARAERLVPGTRDHENFRSVVGAEGDDGVCQRHRQLVVYLVVNGRAGSG
jgi:hypothetical protein